MEHFEACGELSIGNAQWLEARVLFDSYAVDDAEVRREVITLREQAATLVDPHTAVGALAGRMHRRSLGAPMVTLGQIAPSKSAALLAQLGVWEGELACLPPVQEGPPALHRGDLDGLCKALLAAQSRPA
ncbi:threonine synthase [compost metagenome]